MKVGREIQIPVEEYSDPHIALSTSCLYAVTKRGEDESQVTVWDFWSYSSTADCT